MANNKLGTLGQQLMAKADKDTKDFFKQSTVPNPANDGVTHINLSNRGQTRLGRLLSSGDYPFTIPELGHFTSLESFMLFILSKEVNITYPGLPYAKALRKRMRIVPQYSNEHAEYLKDALRHILLRNKMWRDRFLKNTLPFDCYFMPKDSKFPRRPRSADMWIKIIDELKAEFTNGEQDVNRPDYADVLARVEAVMEPVAVQQREKQGRKPVKETPAVETTETIDECEHELVHEEVEDVPITTEAETQAIVEAVAEGTLNTTVENPLVEEAVQEVMGESEDQSTQG